MKTTFILTMQKIMFAIVCVLVLIGCSGTVTCPEFDEGVFSWMPYQKNDIIELYSQSNNSSITTIIESAEITHTTSYEKGKDCGHCDDEISIIGSNFGIYIRLESGKINYQTYRVGDTYFGDWDGNYSYSEFTNFSFEGNTYDAVRVFEKTNSHQFKKLIIAKDIGIIGLVDIDDNTWVLKTNIPVQKSNEPAERGGIVINNTSC